MFYVFTTNVKNCNIQKQEKKQMSSPDSMCVNSSAHTDSFFQIFLYGT